MSTLPGDSTIAGASAAPQAGRTASARYHRPRRAFGDAVLHAPQTLRALVRADEIWLVVLSAFVGCPVSDTQCGFRVCRLDRLRGLTLRARGYDIETEMLIKLRAAGRSVVEVGVPHYPRTAGSATGANPRVVLRAVRDFWLLRLRMWAHRSGALRRGEPMTDLRLP